MAEFIGSNPGLRSRLKTCVDFPNFTSEELTRIFERFARSLFEEAYARMSLSNGRATNSTIPCGASDLPGTVLRPEPARPARRPGSHPRDATPSDSGMSKLQCITRLLALAALLPTPAAAQRFGLAVGFVRMPGQIGNFDSDEGLALRLGAELNPKSVLRFGFEAGVDRLNQYRSFSQVSCLNPAGGTATCYFNSRSRDTGWSLSAILRAGPTTGSVRPYALLGVQLLSVRSKSSVVASDNTGARLPNFEYDAGTADGVLGAPLGAGLLFRPAGSPIGVSIEGRITPLLHSYSGGPALNWSPSLVLGVRWGG